MDEDNNVIPVNDGMSSDDGTQDGQSVNKSAEEGVTPADGEEGQA